MIALQVTGADADRLDFDPAPRRGPAKDTQAILSSSVVLEAVAKRFLRSSFRGSGLPGGPRWIQTSASKLVDASQHQKLRWYAPTSAPSAGCPQSKSGTLRLETWLWEIRANVDAAPERSALHQVKSGERTADLREVQ